MLKEPLQLHCIGGLVICYFYGLPRVTGDIDYYTAVPANLNLLDIAGEGSELSQQIQNQAASRRRHDDVRRLRNKADRNVSGDVQTAAAVCPGPV